MMNTMDLVDKKSFDENGYGIAKGVFSPQEIENLRTDVYRQFEIDKKKGLTYQRSGIAAKFIKGDLLSKELLYKVLLDERVISIARSVLDSNDLVYFGDSSYEIGTGGNGFHRDNIDRSNLDGPDWKGKYTLVRMGIYLQDHKHHSGGLKIRKGSHARAGGEAAFVDNEVGDIVYWDLKILHSGNGVRIKGMPGLSVNIAAVERNIPGFLRVNEQQERISFFMTFALKSKHLHRYLTEYTLKRQDTVEHAKLSAYSDTALNLAKQRHVEVLYPLKDAELIKNMEKTGA